MRATMTITIPFERDWSSYSPEFLAAVEGGGAWSREARILLPQAAARGIRLDENELVWADVHDLRAWRRRLAKSVPIREAEQA
jgi:hypothetical protein